MMPDAIRRFKWIMLAAALPVVFLIAGCDDDDDDVVRPPSGPSITAIGQIVDPADEVQIQQVRSTGAGWIVVHEDENGDPGEIVGIAAVPGGTTQNVTVTLERDVVAPETLIAMLHVDAGTPGVFEFPGPDVPAVRNGQVVTATFQVLPIATTPSLVFNPQSADSLSTLILIEQAVALGPAWAVAHQDAAGEPGEIIGVAPLHFGGNRDVLLSLDRPLVSGETVWVMLHTDAGTIGTFQFPGPDVPVQVAGQPVRAFAVVTVPAGLPAAILRITAQGDQNYLITEVQPQQMRARIVGNQQGDPPLTLRAGWRYQIVNFSAATHPFELIDRGATAAEDVVLLSQTGSGTFTGSAGVAWVQSGNAFRFTVTPELGAVLDGYRAQPHPTAMRGVITIDDPF